ncbi:MAG TPA: phosphatase PAP2 family protein [Acidimicrobiales bacterium]|nr:phosphatase PAP2 family protein [Acidimicrobiales bacterium]
MDRGLPDAAADRLGAQGRWGARELLLGAAVALVGIPFGLLLHQVTQDGPLTQLDERWARWLHERIADDGWEEAILRAVSFTGKPVFLTVAVGLPVLWLLHRGARKLALFLVVVGVGGGLVDTAVKVAVGRPRPEFDEPIATAFGKSFPSGHSMSSLVCYGALLVVFLPLVAPRGRRWCVALTALWVLAIGFSRLALGVHYVSDVLGGYVLGTAWLVGSVAVFEVWRAERGRRATQPLEEGLDPEEAARAVG